MLVFSVVGHIGTTITQSTFNLSYGSSTQGGGFVVFSTTDTKFATNGSSLTFDTFNGLSSLNLSGNVININLTLIQNTTQGQYGNVTFGWVLQTNGSTMLNTTIQNTTANQTAFNYSFNSNLLSDG
ncbi:hypothetical protein HYX14_04765, partial [Candidatus Woesearchaeota archaeon]|nr:hypothetical protein [Candidatus Woesearchaeota archaeon]